MDKSPFLALALTPTEDNQKKFIVFRTEMAGDGETSNMMIIDAVIRALSERQDSVENTEFTWGMLKNGFPKSGN